MNRRLAFAIAVILQSTLASVGFFPKHYGHEEPTETMDILRAYLLERQSLFGRDLFVMVCAQAFTATQDFAPSLSPFGESSLVDSMVFQPQCSRGSGGVLHGGVVLPTLLVREIQSEDTIATVEAEFMRGPPSVLDGREAVIWPERALLTRQGSEGRWLLQRIEIHAGQRIYLRTARDPR